MYDYSADQLYEEHGICNKTKCSNCVYCYRPKEVLSKSCDYILIEGHRRPCPAGKNCTVFKKKIGKRKLKAKPIVQRRSKMLEIKEMFEQQDNEI